MTKPSRPRRGPRFRLMQTSLRTLQKVQQNLTGAQIYLRHRIAFEYRFERRPDDVFIATYPKSGTTVLQMMVHQLRGDGSMDIPHITAVVPWLEPELFAENYEFFASMPSPRVFKTHLLYHLLPRNAKYIYVLRDVRDVFLSSYHHQCMITGLRLKPEVFARQFQQSKAFFGTWFQHLASWWPHRHDPNVLFLTYEGMIADLEGTVRRVAGFCGLPLDETQMPRILERCGIEYMKRHEAKFDPRLHQVDTGLASFIRKGKPGRWREDLPAAHRESLERQVRQLAQRLGCEEEDPFAYLLRAGDGADRGQAATAARPGRLSASH